MHCFATCLRYKHHAAAEHYSMYLQQLYRAGKEALSKASSAAANKDMPQGWSLAGFCRALTPLQPSAVSSKEQRVLCCDQIER
jgi:hypothetical protein